MTKIKGVTVRVDHPCTTILLSLIPAAATLFSLSTDQSRSKTKELSDQGSFASCNISEERLRKTSSATLVLSYPILFPKKITLGTRTPIIMVLQMYQLARWHRCFSTHPASSIRSVDLQLLHQPNRWLYPDHRRHWLNLWFHQKPSLSEILR